MEPGDPPHALKMLPERSAISVSQPSRSWIGSMIVIVATVFFALSLNEGNPGPYQREIDSLMHNWLVMGCATFVVWLARRQTFGPLPSLLRKVSFLVFNFFIIFTVLGLFTWQPFWDALKPFGVIQSEVQAVAVFGAIWLWGACLMGLGARRAFRWFRKTYEHHGITIGFGPLYFYFRRRRVS